MEAHEGEIKIDSDRPPFAASPNPDHSPVTAPKHVIHRERDSLDDFEHLDRDMDRSPAKEAAEPGGVRPATPEEAAFGTPERTLPAGAGEGARSLQAFLDTEREDLVVEPVLLPAPLMPEPAPAPPQPRPEPPAPPVLREPSPSHHETVYSDSREELSEEEQERPSPHVVPTRTPSPPPARAAPPPVPVTPVTPAAPAPTPAPVSKVAPASPAQAAPTAPVPAILQELGLVEALVYWRCPARSAAALGGGLALLLALACCSLISVLAYLALLILVGTVAFRLYRNVAQAVQKTSDGHPFKELLETDLTVSPEKAQEVAVWGTAHLNASVAELRRLFLVEDLVDSLKFGVMLWCFTYVGAWFNGMTLIIIAYVAFFTVPKVYETNKTQIDANLEVVSAKFQEFTNKVRAAIPIGKKVESEKEK